MTQVGTSIGLAVNTIVQSKVTQHFVEKDEGVVYSPNVHAGEVATNKGLVASFWGCAAFAWLGFVIAVATLHGIGCVGEKKIKIKGDNEEKQG